VIGWPTFWSNRAWIWSHGAHLAENCAARCRPDRPQRFEACYLGLRSSDSLQPKLSNYGP
jgi:hypothetical protein